MKIIHIEISDSLYERLDYFSYTKRLTTKNIIETFLDKNLPLAPTHQVNRNELIKEMKSKFVNDEWTKWIYFIDSLDYSSIAVLLVEIKKIYIKNPVDKKDWLIYWCKRSLSIYKH